MTEKDYLFILGDMGDSGTGPRAGQELRTMFLQLNCLEREASEPSVYWTPKYLLPALQKKGIIEDAYLTGTVEPDGPDCFSNTFILQKKILSNCIHNPTNFF